MVKNSLQKSQGGFTIIETMVATSLFLLVTTVGIGALLNANLIHQKSEDKRSILDNLSFVMEEMSRNIRTGYAYHCFTSGESIPSDASVVLSTPKSCARGWALSFEYVYGDYSELGDQWVYYISEEGKVFKATNQPYDASGFVQLTSDEIFVDPELSHFVVVGAESPLSSNYEQPMVTIRLVGTITYQGVTTPFALQNTLSQRLLDI